jgi:hypothetical protein
MMADPIPQLGPTKANSIQNQHQFMIDQAMGRVSGAKVVKIVAIHGGGIGEPGTVDVQPLVNQIDGGGNSQPHGTIYGIPYTRSQGGGNVVVNDPVVGDVGYMLVADRDISAVKSTKKAANPGSLRRFDPADGVYIGAMLNSAPTQHIAFTAGGIEISDKNGNKIVMGAGGIAITSSGLTHNGTNISATHVHTGVTPGGSNTGAPA